MRITDDPISDFERWDAEQQEELEGYPKCECCGEHITDDFFYIIADEYICEACLESEFRRRTEDYID